MSTTAQPDNGAGFLLRSEERLQLDTEWVAAERIVVRRRVVTETVTLTVDVQREELVFEQAAIAELPIQTTPLPYVPPLVLTLHEQVPVVTLTTRPYEQVTVSVVQVGREQNVDVTLDREQFELQTRDDTGAHRRVL